MTEVTGRRAPRMDRFLKLAVDRGASDLFFCVGQPPTMRLDGVIEPIRYRTINQADFELHLGEIAPEDRWQRFVEGGDCDLAYEISGLARFRINLFRQSRGDGAAFRVIPTRQFSFEQLGLPPQVARFTEMRWGLVLITGPTGSGKSTTLSALVNHINRNSCRHVVTIEDPVEFVHHEVKSLVTQREIGAHATSFPSALAGAMREDADVIMIGEMRDRETIQNALSAAETGLLVFGTLHTRSTAKTVDRILSAFMAEEQDVIRSQMSGVLRGVLAQQLMPRIGGGRVAAFEVLFATPALANLIREGKSYQINTLIQLGSREGMVAMDASLFDLIEQELVDPELAYEKSVDPKTFRAHLFEEKGIRVGGDDLDDEEILKILERQATKVAQEEG